MLFGVLLIVCAQVGVTIQVQNPGGEEKLESLNDFISHFEALSYDAESLHAHHNRARRSTVDPYVELQFTAYGRAFHLRLKRDTTTFTKDFQRETMDNMLVDHDTSYIYEGELKGEPNTYVFGSIIKGVFAGTIRTPETSYHVEKSEHYFHGRNKRSFHSIIYADKHVQMDMVRKRREARGDGSGGGTCGSADSSVRDWMNKVQNSVIEDEEPVVTKREPPASEFSEPRPIFENIYTRQYNLHKRAMEKEQEERINPRDKRATGQNRRTCALFLQSDTMMWDYMMSLFDNNKNQVLEEITSLFAVHVKGVKTIYGDAVFQDKGTGIKYFGFSFTVRRVKINDTTVCDTDSKKRSNLFCKTNIDVSNFLNLNSLRNHNDYCLAYVFTYRDFTGGTLGLAWVGSPSTASGGICERWKMYGDSGNKVSKSLNTGIVTLLNYGKRVPPKVSTLTFAHELGHNFGSPHDGRDDCVAVSGSQEGNYIMFASATSGDLPNNNRFSTCSLANITAVLDVIINQRKNKKNCFVEREEAFCGNRIVEAAEMCDCGYADDCNDKCCNAYRNTDNIPSCTLKPTAMCSPTAGPCCTPECTKIPASANKTCRFTDSCNQESSCNGEVAACPASSPKPNNTACNKFTQICVSGVCTLSICNKIDWDQCYLEIDPETKPKDVDRGNLCYVACRKPGSEECVSTGGANVDDPENSKLKEFLENNGHPDGIKLSPGAPCDNYKGYCDVFQKCRGVDADGPLARLKNLLLNKDTLIRVKDWMVRYWWAVLLIIIAGIILMGTFITLCAVHTPSNNPKRAPARKISLRTPRNRPQGPPPGYSANPSRGGPPHGKGRSSSSSHQQPPAFNPVFQMSATNNQQQQQQRI